MDSFYLIAGLGNPGREYEGTRHNVGFDVVDLLHAQHTFGPFVRDGKALVSKGRIGTARVILMKPQTYMNLSGEAIRPCLDFYKIDHTANFIVTLDDIDLEPGRIRIRKKGSPGGHNGLKNIVQNLGDGDFCRVRVGVGAKPDPDYDLADYVLGHPRGEDRKVLDEAEEKASQAIASILSDGIDRAMNRFN